MYLFTERIYFMLNQLNGIQCFAAKDKPDTKVVKN